MPRIRATRPPAVEEPSLAFLVFVHRHMPGHRKVDPRLVVLEEAARFADRHGLRASGTDWEYEDPTKVDLVKLDRSPPGLERLVNLVATSTDGLTRCVIYAHKDALVVQLVMARLGRADSLAAGWVEVSSELIAGLDGERLAAASQGVFGASAVYWAIASDGKEPAAFADSAPTVTGTTAPRYTETDIGPLWWSREPIVPDAAAISQDRWVLVTHRSPDVEAEANRRYNQLHRQRPPDFAIVALARHKVAWEEAQYRPRHEELHRIRRRIDHRARWIVDTQRDESELLDQLDTPESLEFQSKLTHAYLGLADYQHAASRMVELANTVRINQENFLVNGVALVSGELADRVRGSSRHDETARQVLAEWGAAHAEGIFATEIGQMQNFRDQLAADMGYVESLIARQVASLHSGGEQLRIAQHREIGEISQYHALEAAAVVASLAAIISLELLRLGQRLEHEPVFSANAILLAVTGSFAFVQLLSRRHRVKNWIERASVALAGGFLTGFVVVLVAGEIPLLVDAAVVIAGTAIVAALHLVLEERARRGRRREAERESEDPTLEKLIYATEELPELLEDLPPTRRFRVKREASLLEKLGRKSTERAGARGLTPEELEARGEDYGIVDVGDAIGVRYVVGPTRVADVVRRIAQVTHADPPQYKQDATTIGRRLVDGSWEDDPAYTGRYRGFRMKYRSIHIDIDLWGVGARKDVNLRAEIQVRTPIQDLFPSWYHDLMYKQVESGETPRLARFLHHRAPFANRVLARLMIWLADLEFVLFRGTMEWPDDGLGA